MKIVLSGIILGVVVFVSGGSDYAFAKDKESTLLSEVQARGVLRCGANSGLAGFSSPNEKGELVGFDVDYCRAIAAAIFGTPDKVNYKLLTAKQRFPALQSGEIDVLIRNTTWTISRDTKGLNFPAINYYDGQGFMVKKAIGVSSVKQLSGAAICVQSGTTTELNLADHFRSEGMTFHPVLFEKVEEVNAAYNSGRCDAYTADMSALYAARLVVSDPHEHVILPEVISKEPMGSLVREGDDQWFDIVGWVHYVLVSSEELGITQANVLQLRDESDRIQVKRLLGADADDILYSGLGLSNDWVVNVILAVGNYGEMFDRSLGKKSRLQIARGLNALWSDGGLQYAPPVR